MSVIKPLTDSTHYIKRQYYYYEYVMLVTASAINHIRHGIHVWAGPVHYETGRKGTVGLFKTGLSLHCYDHERNSK
jgi:hypothetical protein